MTRPPSKEYHHIARLCDVGAQGVMPPMINNAQEARQIVSYLKYAPQGVRGCALGLAHDDYRPGPVAGKFKAANEKTALVALIESAEGIKNIDAIAALEGVDCLWVGHFDLSCSLGIPGQFDHELIQQAMRRIAEAAKNAGKHWGCPAFSREHTEKLLELGARFICHHADILMIKAGLEQIRRDFAPLGFSFDDRRDTWPESS